MSPLSSRRWLPVVLWVAVIYTTIPFVRVFREWFVARWDPLLIGIGVAAALVVAAAVTVVGLSKKPGGLTRARAAWVTVVAVVLLLWTYHLRHSPEEAVHFLEYGVLAVLVHRALRPTMPDATIYLAGALVGLLIGTVDEVIQWFSPNRYWDWRDIVLNGGAGALVQLALWRIGPPSVSPLGAGSTRTVLRLAGVQLLLLTLCLANTPQRVAWYAPRLPGCDHLLSTTNPMAEYGNRHTAPGIGVFNSRLTLAELRAEDTKRAGEVAAHLDEFRQRYDEFLDTWPVAADPFTYEVRIHLFARNRNLGKAREAGFQGVLAREQLTTAWYENLLLEYVFGATLDHSSYRWRPDLRRRIEAEHDPDAAFESAVGAHLITFASERQLLGGLLAGIVLLVLADSLLSRNIGRQK